MQLTKTKIMKTFIYTLFILTTTISFSQNPNLHPFVGDWQWTEGNQTFTVNIYIDGDILKGDYEMTTNGSLGLGYKSNRLLIPEINYYYGYAIYAGSHNGIYFSGSITDNVQFGDGVHSVKMGQIKFTIQNNCSGCPTTALWKVSELMGSRHHTEPENFTIPTDIILTKIE